MEAKSCHIGRPRPSQEWGEIFLSRPAIAEGQLAQLMLPFGWGDDPALIALISWACSLRVPSEGLPIARQRLGEYLSADSRLEGEAVFGLADRKRIIRLNQRKHIAGGPGMIRTCVREECAPDSLELHVPQLLCPPCRLRPAITRKAAMRDLFSRAGRPEGFYRSYEPGNVWAPRRMLIGFQGSPGAES